MADHEILDCLFRPSCLLFLRRSSSSMQRYGCIIYVSHRCDLCRSKNRATHFIIHLMILIPADTDVSALSEVLKDVKDLRAFGYVLFLPHASIRLISNIMRACDSRGEVMATCSRRGLVQEYCDQHKSVPIEIIVENFAGALEEAGYAKQAKTLREQYSRENKSGIHYTHVTEAY